MSQEFPLNHRRFGSSLHQFQFIIYIFSFSFSCLRVTIHLIKSTSVIRNFLCEPSAANRIPAAFLLVVRFFFYLHFKEAISDRHQRSNCLGIMIFNIFFLNIIFIWNESNNSNDEIASFDVHTISVGSFFPHSSSLLFLGFRLLFVLQYTVQTECVWVDSSSSCRPTSTCLWVIFAKATKHSGTDVHFGIIHIYYSCVCVLVVPMRCFAFATNIYTV